MQTTKPLTNEMSKSQEQSLQEITKDLAQGKKRAMPFSAIGITLFESNEWGGWKIRKDKCSPTIRAEKVCVGAIIKEYESNKYSNENKNLCRDTAKD